MLARSPATPLCHPTIRLDTTNPWYVKNIVHIKRVYQDKRRQSTYLQTIKKYCLIVPIINLCLFRNGLPHRSDHTCSDHLTKMVCQMQVVCSFIDLHRGFACSFFFRILSSEVSTMMWRLQRRIVPEAIVSVGD